MRLKLVDVDDETLVLDECQRTLCTNGEPVEGSPPRHRCWIRRQAWLLKLWLM